jgi:hypothetical protein
MMEFIALGVGSGGTGIQFTNIPSYSAIVVQFFCGVSATGSAMRVALSSNNGSSYGSIRAISTSNNATKNGWAHISNTNNNGASKVVTPASHDAGSVTTYSTQATEATVTGVINAIDVDNAHTNSVYTAILWGIV